MVASSVVLLVIFKLGGDEDEERGKKEGESRNVGNDGLIGIGGEEELEEQEDEGDERRRKEDEECEKSAISGKREL